MILKDIINTAKDFSSLTCKVHTGMALLNSIVMKFISKTPCNSIPKLVESDDDGYLSLLPHPGNSSN